MAPYITESLKQLTQRLLLITQCVVWHVWSQCSRFATLCPPLYTSPRPLPALDSLSLAHSVRATASAFLGHLRYLWRIWITKFFPCGSFVVSKEFVLYGLWFSIKLRQRFLATRCLWLCVLYLHSNLWVKSINKYGFGFN